MDQNSNNDRNELEFGIHLDNLSESETESDRPAEATEPAEAAISHTESTEPHTADTTGAKDAPDAPYEPPEKGVEQLFPAIKGIEQQLENLADAFESKIKYDEHKNKVIDDLHQSLQDYRNGLLKKYLQRIFTDVIKIIDDARKLIGHYREQPLSEENNAKLLQYLEDMAQELEDMFAWEGVEAFTTEGDTLEPTRQRVVNKIETDDPLKDKTIAQRLRPGYEWDGKVIRPEIVSIYICNRESTADNADNKEI
ncbi:MAG: nucleotide exchange factor GrpE [Desulfobacterales bacterium]|nr:nucleotide exchange factor GrpE [Desulfobacterales bacterium]